MPHRDDDDDNDRPRRRPESTPALPIVLMVIGAMVAGLGASSVPRLLARIGQEDGAHVLGRGFVVGAEIVLGVMLVVYGLKKMRSAKK